MPIHAHFFRLAVLTRKIGQTDLVFGLRSELIGLVGLCMQDYKSLCVAVMICATLVNIQTHIHRHTDRQTDGHNILTSLYEQPNQRSY